MVGMNEVERRDHAGSLSRWQTNFVLLLDSFVCQISSQWSQDRRQMEGDGRICKSKRAWGSNDQKIAGDSLEGDLQRRWPVNKPRVHPSGTDIAQACLRPPSVSSAILLQMTVKGSFQRILVLLWFRIRYGMTAVPY